MRRIAPGIALALITFAPAAAQDRDVPYWASLRYEEVNMRVGPSEEYKIDWVYKRKGLPVKVIRLKEGWRLIKDPDGAEGWVVSRLLNPERTAVVTGKEPAPVHEDADEGSAVKWRAEPGVVGKLGKCDQGWCEFDMTGRKGWVREASLWGAGNP